MDAPDLLQYLLDSGFLLEVDGDLLTVTPRDRITDEMRQAIRIFKPDLLVLLAGAKPKPNQSPYWPVTRKDSQSDLTTMEARLSILVRRGMHDIDAVTLVDRLMQGDRDQSEQVTCYLCLHFNSKRKTCGNFRSAGVGQEVGSDLAAMLQRCPGYQLTRI